MSDVHYTPDEIEAFLRQFFDTVGRRQYIGARYVPQFGRRGESTIEWDEGEGAYEPLTIVTYQGNSYTSRTYVPVGVNIINTDYWAETGSYNAQIELYRQEVINAVREFDELKKIIPANSFSSSNTVKDYIDNFFIEENTIKLTNGFSTILNSTYIMAKIPKGAYIPTGFVQFSDTTWDKLEPILKEQKGIFVAPNLTSDYYMRNHEIKAATFSTPESLLCIKDDYDMFTMHVGSSLPSQSELISLGVRDALWVWEQLYVNGEPITHTSNDCQPRCVIGWDNNYYYILHINGRSDSHGASLQNIIDFLADYNLNGAVNCDGGGSIQMWTCPYAVNLSSTIDPYDSSRTTGYRRKCLTGFIYNNE